MNQEDVILGLEAKLQNLDQISKEHEKLKNWNHTEQGEGEETHGNMGHHKENKPSNYRHRRGRRIPSQWNRPDLQENHRRKVPQKKEKDIPIRIQEAHRTLNRQDPK